MKEHEMPGGLGTYTLFQIEGKDVAGAYTLAEEQKTQGLPPHWLSYVMVKSADESARKAKKLGATFFMEPMDVPGVGTMAILQDPSGASLPVPGGRARRSGASGQPAGNVLLERARDEGHEGGEEVLRGALWLDVAGHGHGTRRNLHHVPER
jgi:predicted enzyme related to lactoylglutathione lyase